MKKILPLILLMAGQRVWGGLVATDPTPAVPELTKDASPKDRKLYEMLTSSYLTGDMLQNTDTHHLILLINQQKAMQNFRMISGWLNDVEEKLDDMRDAVNRKLSDMATGLERRNMMIGNTNPAGVSSGKLPYN